MVRAASSGVSCLVDAEGRVRESLPEGKAAQGVFRLAYHDARWTPYRLLGDDGAMALFAALGGLTLFALKRLG